jgi:hypothetical protein
MPLCLNNHLHFYFYEKPLKFSSFSQSPLSYFLFSFFFLFFFLGYLAYLLMEEKANQAFG